MKTTIQFLALWLLLGLIGEMLLRPGAPQFEGVIAGPITIGKVIRHVAED